MPDPSFDVVSEVDLQEVVNAVAQAHKEISQRYDLKGTAAGVTLNEKERTLTFTADDEFGLRAVDDVVKSKLVKRNVPLKSLSPGAVEPAAKGTVRQVVAVQHGIPTEKAKEIVKAIKDAKLKVQAAIQSEQVRVTGKKKDDLQSVITLLRQKDFGLPLQFTNYRG